MVEKAYKCHSPFITGALHGTSSKTNNRDYQIQRLVHSFRICVRWAQHKYQPSVDMNYIHEQWHIENVFQQGVFYGLNWSRSLCDK